MMFAVMPLSLAFVLEGDATASATQAQAAADQQSLVSLLFSFPPCHMRVRPVCLCICKGASVAAGVANGLGLSVGVVGGGGVSVCTRARRGRGALAMSF